MISKKLVEELVNERIAELDNGLFIVDISISKSNSISFITTTKQHKQHKVKVYNT